MNILEFHSYNQNMLLISQSRIFTTHHSHREILKGLKFQQFLTILYLKFFVHIKKLNKCICMDLYTSILIIQILRHPFPFAKCFIIYAMWIIYVFCRNWNWLHLLDGWTAVLLFQHYHHVPYLQDSNTEVPLEFSELHFLAYIWK